jgi:hypothetical protein
VKGRYAVYVVAIPGNDGGQMDSRPVTGSSARLTVTPFDRLTAQSVLPLAIGMPSGVTVAMVFLRWRRRREIDAGDNHRSE